ncbi:hypothetical protein AX17_006948 [Amanita inopinata Kibby_2008]|nr:hypothetical protein AX17_006948 [Amanita inopinata Kibby_2008]
MSENDARASGPKQHENDAEGTEEEGEYEIEVIMEAKRGMFPHGRMGYLVKWKGYGEEENSWVDENDAGNADELIKTFWSRKKSRKSETKGKRGRKSTATVDEESEAGSVAPKKKSRTGQPKRVSYEPQERDGTGKKDEDGNVVIGDMTDYMSVPSWEELIQSIDTIEKSDDGDFLVYFSLKSGEKVKADSKICRLRCPQKLISFYEEHLRWKEADRDEEIV